MSIFRTLIIAAVLVHCAFAARLTILGVQSDPCADAAPWNGGADPARMSIAQECGRFALPDSAVTIYVPSTGSQNANGVSTASQGIQAGTQTAVITVDNLSKPNEVTTADFFCLAPYGGNCNNVAALVDCTPIGNPNNQFTFTIPAAWTSIPRELEDEPREICIRKAGGFALYTGLKLASVFNCVADADCTAHPGISQSGNYVGVVGPLEARVLSTRATCCRNADVGLGVGICINANVQTCCGGAALETVVERCCDETNHRIRGINQPCPCFGANNGGAAALGCPTGETCCLPTRFSEFDTVTNIEGRCYNGATERCCNTGELYDPGTAQCCVINGVQSINTPCPCDQDAHCLGASVSADDSQTTPTMRCCRQRFPTPTQTAQCTPFANFPSRVDVFGNVVNTVRDNDFRAGQNLVGLQRCPGQCIDTRFQMCCNGIACVQGYEKCCNNTCCNKFVGKCAESYRAGALGDGISNGLDFNAPRQICTIIENLGPLKTYWVFVLPTFLLAATLLSLALVIIYASSSSTRAFSFIERAIVLLAVLIVLFACPLFFSPAYKYGIVMVIVGLIAILSASARVWWLNVLALGASIVLILFFVDPFHGNQFWNFANGRLFNGNPDYEQMGVLHTIDKMWTGTANFQRQDFCVQFYDYFQLDPNLQDPVRRDNAQQGTFGFCIRQWVAALLILELFALLLILLLFVLLVLALTLRFRKVAPLPAIVEPAYVDIY
jgi:hypothetical protein